MYFIPSYDYTHNPISSQSNLLATWKDGTFSPSEKIAPLFPLKMQA